jgi:replicative DNA helicase
MATLYSPRAELAVLMGLFNPDRKVVGTLLSGVDASYFYTNEATEIFKRVNAAFAQSGEGLQLDVFLEDPTVSKEAREFLRDAPSVVTTTTEATEAVHVLQNYRKMRGLHKIAHEIDGMLNEDSIDTELILTKVGESLTAIRQSKSQEKAFLHFGSNNNSAEFVKKLIYDDPGEEIIPTGIEDFDSVNYGLMRGSLTVIGGNSGAGKSHVATALAVNMANMGYRIVLVPLEMSNREMVSRLLANVARVNSLHINGFKNSPETQHRLFAEYKKWAKGIKDKGGRLSIYKPDQDVTIEEVFAAISTYPCDVLIIDYITLLKGTDGPDQWKDLGRVARLAKINAELNNRVNILLSQVDDHGKIRYSQTVKEHSSNAWVFVANKDTKQQGILKVEQIKSRNQTAFPFTIKIEYEYSTIKSIDHNYEEAQSVKVKQNFDSINNLAAD